MTNSEDISANKAIEKIKGSEIVLPEKFYHEINLLRIEGFYFCLDPKKAKSSKSKEDHTESLPIDDNDEALKKATLTIQPHPKHGKPSIVAYKLLQNILKKYSDIPTPMNDSAFVHFNKSELAKAVTKRSKVGGKDLQDIQKAIDQLEDTKIIFYFYLKDSDNHKKGNKKSKWEKVSMRLIDNSLLAGEGDETSDYIFCLNRLLIQSINKRHTFCINYSRMNHLEPIGNILYKRIFTLLCKLYSKTHNENITLTKNYGEICRTWLGGLNVLKYKSQILRDQLGPHFNHLKKTHMIKKIEINKNSKGTGFNIVFYPGNAFFEDYNHFYGQNLQTKIPFEHIETEKEYKIPMDLVSYFYKTLYGTDDLQNIILQKKAIASLLGWIVINLPYSGLMLGLMLL